MNVTLYTFAKADNSTAQPTGGTAVSGILKSPCSIQSPMIEFDFGTTDAPAFNYAFIDAFGRFYRVEKWTWDGRLWVAEMSGDPLGTFKSYIGASTQYVLRSASSADIDVVDMFYPTKGGAVVAQNGVILDTTLYGDISVGCYILGIINNDSGAIGSVSYYVFNNVQLRSLCDALFSSTSWLGEISDITEELLKSLFNPFQYIVSCYWFPFLVTGTSTSTLKFGWWDLSVSCKKLSTSTEIINGHVDIPKHPSGGYMMQAPYSHYELMFGSFGRISIPPALLYNYDELQITFRIDLVSGIGRLSLSYDGNEAHAFSTYDAGVGVPIQLAQVMRDYMGIATSTVGGIGSVLGSLATGNIGGAIINGSAAIANIGDSLMPDVSTAGQNGTTIAWVVSPFLQLTYYNTTGKDPARFGSPLCKLVTISTLSGFIMTRNAHMDTIPIATAEEIREIENYMDSGFFYE